jgi:hypothetical protein
MLVRLRLVLLFLVFAISANAQNLLTSPRNALEGQVFRLSLDNARLVATGKVTNPDESWFQDRVATFPGTGPVSNELAPGHYLTGLVVQNEVKWSYLQVPGFSVIIENDYVHPMVKVFDFSGRVVSDALVQLGGVPMLFDVKTQTYKPGSKVEQGLLEVHSAGMVQFYQLIERGIDNSEHRGSVAKRWLWWPFRRWIISPIWMTVKLPYDLVASVVKRRPLGWPGWVTYRSIWLYRKLRNLVWKQRPVNFLLCSQPKYRPGDTVKVKAYLTDRGGRPLRKTYQLLYTDKNGKTRRLANVKPVRPGCYTAQFVLHDSLELRLDQQVDLILASEKKWKGAAVGSYYDYNWRGANAPQARTKFFLEDYELKQITFSFRPEAASHWRGKKAVFFLEAKDMNGLTVPDARGKVYLISDYATKWLGDHEFLPDTLWSWSGNLDVTGETRLEVPLDRFPAAEFPYIAYAECRTSDNELKSANQKMTFLYEKDKIVVNRQGDTLSIALMRAGKEISAEAEIHFHPFLGDSHFQKWYKTLPCKLYWPENGSSMTIQTENAFLRWTPGTETDVAVVGQHFGDSLFISARSPDKTNFTYHLFEKDKEIATGITKELRYHQSANRGHAYHLIIHRVVNGSASTREYTYHWRKNDLKVDWKGPATIYPGMTADLSVEVHDQRGKPIRKADVTAYAVNSRFEGHDPSRIPSASKPAKPRQKRGQWNSNAFTSVSNGRIPLNYDRWYLTSGLDTLPWYNFLYPKEGFYKYLHPIEAGKAEIAPFVVRKGAIQPVQIVYIDSQPFYFAWSVPQMPYSFHITPGKHRIEVRLPDFGVLLDTFMVEAGYKTIISMDVAHLPKRVFGKAMTPDPVPGERDVIYRHSFAYRGLGAPAFVHTGGRLLRLDGPHGSNWNGPVHHYSSMKIDVPGYYEYDFDFEPGFELDFGPRVVKMRTLEAARYPQKLNYQILPLVEHRPWIKDSIVAQWRRSQQPRNTYYDWKNYHYRNHSGRLFLHTSSKGLIKGSPSYLAFLDDSKNIMHVITYSSYLEMYGPIGKWKAALLYDDDRFVMLDTIEILPNGRNFHRFSFSASQVQDSFSLRHPRMIQQLRPETYMRPMTQSHETYQSFRGDWSGPTRRVTGRISDAATGEGLAGAMVICPKTNVGAITAEDGSFALNVPESTDTIVVSYLGYQKAYILWNRLTRLDVGLNEQSIDLDAVLIRGQQNRYHQESMSMSTSSMDVVSARKVDLQVTSNIQDVLSVRGGRLSELAVITGGTPAEYGDVIGGVLNVPAFPQELLDALAGTSTLRKDFRDNAIWEPTLRSDKKGVAAFRVKFPEDITRWDAYAIAVDRHGRTGLTHTAIKAWKPIAGRLAMPRFFYEGDTAYVIGKVLNYTGDTIQMRRSFKQSGQVLSVANGDVGPVVLDTLAVIPNTSADSFTLSYMAEKADGYGDGEQWGVRVFKKGVEESSGMFATLIGDSTLKLSQFDPNKGQIHLRTSVRLHDFFLTETTRMANYEHLCNEQLSSKLIALLAEQQIFKSLGRPWSGESEIRKVIAMLERRHETKEIGWGWWPGMPTEDWVSVNVIRALFAAKKAGYSFNIPYFDWSPPLLSRLEKRNPWKNLSILQLVQEIDTLLDIRSHIEALDTAKFKDVPTQIAIMELRQKAGMTIDTDSLMRLSRFDLYGQRYWPAGYAHSYAITFGDLPSTLAAYRILRRSGKTVQEMVPVLAWILGQGSSGGWGNTYFTGQVLRTLVPDIGLAGVEGKSSLEYKINGVAQVMRSDSTLTFPPGTTIEINKKVPGIAFVGAYQDWFNPQPEKIDSLFRIITYFQKGNKPVKTLTAGEQVTMHVSVQVNRDAEYLMLEVPIPASCSYASKTGGYYDYRYNSYRESFRQKTAFYFRSLRAGTYSFEIELLPRYTGSYTLNTARIEHMYFPVLSGQNEIQRVKVVGE